MPTETVLLNGRFTTLDPALPEASAVATASILASLPRSFDALVSLSSNVSMIDHPRPVARSEQRLR